MSTTTPVVFLCTAFVADLQNRRFVAVITRRLDLTRISDFCRTTPPSEIKRAVVYPPIITA